MSTTTLTDTQMAAFQDYANMQSDESVIFAAHALEGYEDRGTGRKYWALISILTQRHPEAMKKALKTSHGNKTALQILLPYIVE